MKWMPKWLHEMLYDCEPLVEVKLTVETPKPEPVKPEPRQLVVGEPVLSLIASIRSMEGWEFVGSEYGAGFGNEEHQLVVTFSRKSRSYIGRPLYRCKAEWMTDDEQEYIENVFEELAAPFIQRAVEKKRQEQKAKNAEDRERFMVLVTK